MTIPALAAGTAAPAASAVHDSLYETCATLIIAVLVVIYFDKQVRDRLAGRMRGYVIGSLGGVIGVGLLTPLFVLAGFIADTVSIRRFVVYYTLAFLVAAFAVAVSMWGAEDRTRNRSAPRMPAFAPALPAARAGQTEREHAAEVIGAALAIASQAHPDLVALQLRSTGAGPEWERLRELMARWIALLPLMFALGTGYPSAGVRAKAGPFILAGDKAIAGLATVVGDGMLAGGQVPQAWKEQASPAYSAFLSAGEALVSALHPEDVAVPAAEPGYARPPRGRTKGTAPKWLNRTPGARDG